MFSAWRARSKEIWGPQLMVDHPAGGYSPNQYITRDDVHTDPVSVPTLVITSPILPPRTIARAHHCVTRFTYLRDAHGLVATTFAGLALAVICRVENPELVFQDSLATFPSPLGQSL
jgi:hypothetical protein